MYCQDVFSVYMYVLDVICLYVLLNICMYPFFYILVESKGFCGQFFILVYALFHYKFFYTIFIVLFLLYKYFSLYVYGYFKLKFEIFSVSK